MKEAKFTHKDLSILDYILKQPFPVGPTEIGLNHSQPYNNASSYCTASLKKLIKAGKIKRFNGKYSAIKA